MNRPNQAQALTVDPQRYVSTAQVANALGVSVTTVKRWVDDGVLPAHRTVGGHRKLQMSDVLRLVREGNLPQADLTRLLPKCGPPAAQTDSVRQQLVAAIDAEDGDLIRTLLLGAYQSGIAIEALADEILSPAMTHVGHEWETGRMAVMGEHRITLACVAALYELRALLRANAEPNRPVAVGGAPEHDHYMLPSLCAELTLLDAGWDAVNLGPHTPMSAFATALDELNPTLVWLSVSHLRDADAFVREYKQFFARADGRGVAVAIGGNGLSASLRAKLPYTTFGDGLTQLALFAKSLYRRPTLPKRGRPLGKRGETDDGAVGEAE